MIRTVINIVWYNLFICVLVNAVVFPLAYWLKPKKGVLWYFLHDGNMYGDSTFHPKMKEKLLKAWLWALRNPLHNYYYRNYTEGKETNLKGTARVKSGKNVSSWRTFTCMDTGDNNGNIIDFDNSLFGYQSATFDRNGKSQYRKSYCKPFNYWVFIIIFRWRFGYEKGLFQSQFNFPIMWMNKDNRTNYIEWKQLKYKNIER